MFFTNKRLIKGACHMWVVTVFEQQSFRIFEYHNQSEAKETLARYSENARLSYVA